MATSLEETRTFPDVSPHGKLETVIPDKLYSVQGSFAFMPGIRITRTMTIVKSDNSDLTIIKNSVRVNPETEQEIKKLGTIKNLVRLTMAHGVDDPYYLHTFKPKYYSVAPNEELAKKDAPHDVTLTEESELPLPDAKLILFQKMSPKETEGVLWIPDNGGILFTADAVQHEGTVEHANLGGKLLSAVMGFNKPCQCPPLWRMLAKFNAEGGTDACWTDFERIFNLEWDNLCSGPVRP